VADGLALSRTRAQALIRAGRVLVDDCPVDKPGARVAELARVRVRGEDRAFASRGGEKLAGALADLGLDPRGLACLDVGASTGGFTDCLLRHGAVQIVAVDVGYGQLDYRLRTDRRVRVLERTNARYLSPADVPVSIDLVTVDVSFISAARLLPQLVKVAPRADFLVLVKPRDFSSPAGAGRRAARRSSGVGLTAPGSWRKKDETLAPRGVATCLWSR
jgi:23S rRNA (cytidine1920-2'-O)/16S rRNA (cytidine1409-2'-O)-methyltransferase